MRTNEAGGGISWVKIKFRPGILNGIGGTIVHVSGKLRQEVLLDCPLTRRMSAQSGGRDDQHGH